MARGPSKEESPDHNDVSQIRVWRCSLKKEKALPINFTDAVCCALQQAPDPVNPKSLKLLKASEIRPLRPYLRPPFKAAAALFKAVGPYLRLQGPYLRLLEPYLRLLVIWGVRVVGWQNQGDSLKRYIKA